MNLLRCDFVFLFAGGAANIFTPYPIANLRCFPQKVLFLKILSLFALLSFSEFHRETTLRTPRELPDTANIEKVRFVNILIKSPFVFSDTNGVFFVQYLAGMKKM